MIREDPVADASESPVTHSGLATVRLRSQRQGTGIVGAAVHLSLVGFIAMGMLGSLEGRAAYFASVFPIAFALAYLRA
jgi:hypothetical protein